MCLCDLSDCLLRLYLSVCVCVCVCVLAEITQEISLIYGYCLPDRQKVSKNYKKQKEK